MSKLANTAAKQKKPNKKEAQDILRTLADKHPESLEALSHLYTYFMPPAPKKAKTAWEWITLAMGYKDRREELNYVYVNERHIVSTDGHRLHLMPNNDGLEPGFYLANGDKVHDPDYRRYPDYERIIPNKSRMVAEQISEAPERVEIGNVHVYRMPWTEEYGLNAQYLEAALMLDGYPATVLRDEEPNAHHAVLFESGERVAVIMPCKL